MMVDIIINLWYHKYILININLEINMAKHRIGRINDEVRNEVAAALREVKDPRVANAFVSVTAADVTGDLKFAKIYYSALKGDSKEVAMGLRSSSGFIRRHLASSLNLRMTPELTFIEDKSISHGAHISELLHSIEPAKTENDD